MGAEWEVILVPKQTPAETRKAWAASLRLATYRHEMAQRRPLLLDLESPIERFAEALDADVVVETGVENGDILGSLAWYHGYRARKRNDD